MTFHARGCADGRSALTGPILRCALRRRHAENSSGGRAPEAGPRSRQPGPVGSVAGARTRRREENEHDRDRRGGGPLGAPAGPFFHDDAGSRRSGGIRPRPGRRPPRRRRVQAPADGAGARKNPRGLSSRLAGAARSSWRAAGPVRLEHTARDHLRARPDDAPPTPRARRPKRDGTRRLGGSAGPLVGAHPPGRFGKSRKLEGVHHHVARARSPAPTFGGGSGGLPLQLDTSLRRGRLEQKMKELGDFIKDRADVAAATLAKVPSGFEGRAGPAVRVRFYFLFRRPAPMQLDDLRAWRAATRR